MRSVAPVNIGDAAPPVHWSAVLDARTPFGIFGMLRSPRAHLDLRLAVCPADTKVLTDELVRAVQEVADSAL